MTSAKLFILGEERELLWINTNYLRYTAADGSPTSDVEGGFLTLSFVAQESDDVFWHNMTKEVEKETDRMEKGEVHFYNKGDEDLPIRKYKFSDTYLIEYSEVFDAYGTENMHIVLTLSPAIQNYGNGKELIKHWQVSKVPTKPIYYIPKKEKKETRVKTIQLITALDFGSANDNSGTNQQEGMLYGKSYEFKVVAFTEETPADKSIINWAFKYHSLSEDKWIEKKLSVTGDTLKFTLNEKDMCGRFVYIRAYIKDAENEGELKVWKHNRFRWFDRKKIKEEVGNRKLSPWLINQDDTPTCGPSAIMYVLAKRNYNLYSKFVLELHRTGDSKSNNYEIKINFSNSLKEIAETNPNTKKDFPKKMSYSDWIPNCCITDKENILFDFEGNKVEDFSGITTPSRLSMLIKDLIGFKTIINNTNLLFNKTGWGWGATIKDIAELIKAKQNGHEVFLFISINMLYNKISDVIFSTAEHWVVLETIEHGEPGYVNITLYTWGQQPKNKYVLSHEVFKTNYYGYISSK